MATAVTTEHQELIGEQRFVDRVYQRLRAAGDAARAVAADGHARGSLGHHGGLVERDAMVYQAARRLATLDAAHDGLVFGRLDLVEGEQRYIGRIGLRDENRDVLLVDWRAPAASVFYQATAQEPHGVVRRRVLRSVGSKVVSIEDELLDAAAAPDDLPVVGEGALIAELSRARDTSMHSVVATIQKEQDDAIRSPSRGVTTIVGGPGTGKTVVALHRAAYLLYTDRRRFESGGVLVVGPSDVFMRYIARVLPSLGETSVTLRSLGEVVDGVTATRHDPADVAAIKGSARMARVLRRVVRDGVPDAPEEFRVFYRDDVLRLGPQQLRAIRRSLLSGQRRNRVRGRVLPALLDALWEQVGGERALDRGRDEFDRRVGESTELVEFAARWWPALDAVQVLGWLADRERLAGYGRSVLRPDEIDRLVESWADGTLSIEDVPLIDELRYLLGDPPASEQRPGGAEDEDDDRLDGGLRLDPSLLEVTTVDDRVEGHRSGQRTTQRTEDDLFAHLLIDEAQDLSPMQWRMLGRRGRHASWTVVGDQAQSSWPYPEETEQGRQEALAGKPEHRFRLSTNYRNSAEIYDFAARYALTHLPDADLPDAVRRTGVAPVHRTVPPADLGRGVRDALEELAGHLEGTVAVVVPGALRSQAQDWLADRLDDRVRLLGPLDTKGLEFDGIVVAEPAGIVAESPAGTRTLYVVLTRATQRLVTVSTDESWLP